MPALRYIHEETKSDMNRFLLAKLHLDALIYKNNLRAIRLALQQLPSGLNATYDMAMTRIGERGQEDWELAKAVLSWIIFAYQPLSIAQLQHALAISPDDRVICLDACTDEDTLLSVCEGLVDVDGESQIVRLVRKKPRLRYQMIAAETDGQPFRLYGAGVLQSDSRIQVSECSSLYRVYLPQVSFV